MNVQLAVAALLCLVGLVQCQSLFTTCPGENPCQNGASCFYTPRGFNPDRISCVCTPGYVGRRCEHENPCVGVTCQNGGQCKQRPSANDAQTLEGYCQCRAGYSGDQCETYTDPCQTYPCQNGGTCTVMNQPTGSFVPSIPYMGTGRRCDCPAGFLGRDCQFRDPCLDLTCQNGGSCTSGVSAAYSYPAQESSAWGRCNCPPNYTGHQCETYNDPCQTHPCQNGGTCTPLPTGFPTLPTPAGAPNQQPLVNGVPMVEPAVIDASGVQVVQPQVINPTGFPSIYPPPFRPAPPIGMPNPFSLPRRTCQCAPGYTGQSCETQDPCFTMNCQNGGTCIVSHMAPPFPVMYPYMSSRPMQIQPQARCDCRPNYTGTNCETFVDPCTSNPCKNGAACDGTADKMCTCPDGFTGPHCESQEKCSPGYCMNDATCCETRIAEHTNPGQPTIAFPVAGMPGIGNINFQGQVQYKSMASCTCQGSNWGTRCEKDFCPGGQGWDEQAGSCAPCPVDTVQPSRMGTVCVKCGRGLSTNGETGMTRCSRNFVQDDNAPTFSIPTGINQNQNAVGPMFPWGK